MTPTEPPYDLPRVQALTQSLRELLLGAAAGAGPEQRQALTEVADSFQRIAQDFAVEYDKQEAAIAAQLEQARTKMDQAEAIMRQVEDRVKGVASPVAEPDWTLGPRLRDELLARRRAAPATAEPDPTGSLASWALSGQPVPESTPPSPAAPVQAPAVEARPAQSLTSWLADASADQPGEPAEPPADSWQDSMKQWLAKPRGKPKPPE